MTLKRVVGGSKKKASRNVFFSVVASEIHEVTGGNPGVSLLDYLSKTYMRLQEREKGIRVSQAKKTNKNKLKSKKK